MKIEKRTTIYDDLNKYCHHAKPHDFIEITEWTNQEGYDININGKFIQLTYGEFRAIEHLINSLEFKGNERED